MVALYLNFQLASSECNLLAHLSDFVSTLELILHVKSKRVRELGGQMLRQMLKYLTSIYPNEYKSTIYNFDDPSSSVLPIHVSKEWYYQVGFISILSSPLSNKMLLANRYYIYHNHSFKL